MFIINRNHKNYRQTFTSVVDESVLILKSLCSYNQSSSRVAATTCSHLLDHLVALSAVHAQQRPPVLDVGVKHLQDLLRRQLFANPLVLAWKNTTQIKNISASSTSLTNLVKTGWRGVNGSGLVRSGGRRRKSWILTPAAHRVLPTRHDVLALLVLPWDHLKLDAGVSHPVVSGGEAEQTELGESAWQAHGCFTASTQNHSGEKLDYKANSL